MSTLSLSSPPPPASSGPEIGLTTWGSANPDGPAANKVAFQLLLCPLKLLCLQRLRYPVKSRAGLHRAMLQLLARLRTAESLLWQPKETPRIPGKAARASPGLAPDSPIPPGITYRVPNHA
ncbi:hypothetical protein Y1Q_0024592 [Alligator mississippiensis]|nr:hypothetical protein Y1Q_0024592 [Alligator mississippiensis]